MAILKAKKIREINEKEMDEKMKELRLEYSKEMASSEVGGSVKNPGRIGEIKRTIARIKTEKKRREIAAKAKPAAKVKVDVKQKVDDKKTKERRGD